MGLIDYDNITLDECDEDYRYRNRYVEINDGHIIKIIEGDDVIYVSFNR